MVFSGAVTGRRPHQQVQWGLFLPLLFTPFPDRLFVQSIMTVGVQPQAAAEARFSGEMLLWHGLDEFDQPPMSLIPLVQHLRQR